MREEKKTMRFVVVKPLFPVFLRTTENNNRAAKNSPLAQFNRTRISQFFFEKHTEEESASVIKKANTKKL